MAENPARESHLPADVAAAVDAIRQELGPDADTEAVIGALRVRDLGFLKAIMGLMAIKGTPLGDAKGLVHLSPAYADTLNDREESWRLLHEELTYEANHNRPPGQQRDDDPFASGTATSTAQRSDMPPP